MPCYSSSGDESDNSVSMFASNAKTRTKKDRKIKKHARTCETSEDSDQEPNVGMNRKDASEDETSDTESESDSCDECGNRQKKHRPNASSALKRNCVVKTQFKKNNQSGTKHAGKSSAKDGRVKKIVKPREKVLLSNAVCIYPGPNGGEGILVLNVDSENQLVDRNRFFEVVVGQPAPNFPTYWKRLNKETEPFRRLIVEHHQRGLVFFHKKGGQLRETWDIFGAMYALMIFKGKEISVDKRREIKDRLLDVYTGSKKTELEAIWKCFGMMDIAPVEMETDTIKVQIYVVFYEGKYYVNLLHAAKALIGVSACFYAGICAWKYVLNIYLYNESVDAMRLDCLCCRVLLYHEQMNL